MTALHKVGQTETIVYRWLWRECSVCFNPAHFCITFVLENARNNPSSSAYRRDDISWCADEKDYACRKHVQELERHPPDGMIFCSEFPLKNFQHMGFYKKAG